MAAGGPGILFVGNQAGLRSDECAQAADIHTDEQGQIIPGKAGKKNCRGHVADALAGNGGGEQRVARQQRFEQRAYGRDAAEVAGEDEKTAEGEQQAGHIF